MLRLLFRVVFRKAFRVGVYKSKNFIFNTVEVEGAINVPFKHLSNFRIL